MGRRQLITASGITLPSYFQWWIFSRDSDLGGLRMAGVPNYGLIVGGACAEVLDSAVGRGELLGVLRALLA